MFNKYYQDELLYLRDLGREFARNYPEAAPFLAEPGSDPGVERMLEGFAFISGRLREKIDDELPEITHTLLATFFPHYLQPLPSTTVVQFEPLPQFAREIHHIARGTPLESLPVDGLRCRFQTTAAVELVPLRISEVTLVQGTPAELRVAFQLTDPLAVGKLAVKRLRLHLAGDVVVARALHLCLHRKCEQVTVRVGERSVALAQSAVQAVGFAADEDLSAGIQSGAAGQRLLHEYFAFPAKFMFIDVVGLDAHEDLARSAAFELRFHFSRLPESMPPVAQANLQLNCTPAVNLFPHQADPIRISPERTDYLVRPAGANPAHYEVASVTAVQGLVRGAQQPRPYRPYLNLTRSQHTEGGFYVERRRPSLIGHGHDLYLSLAGSLPAADSETLGISLVCTNRHLPESLAPGDLNQPTSGSPAFARFRNLSQPTPSISPPLTGDLPWRFLSQLALTHLTLADLPSLRRTLELYDLRGAVDHQAAQLHRRLSDSLSAISLRPATRMLDGTPVRGVAIELAVNEEQLGGSGELYFLAAILERFFAASASMNSFSVFQARGVRHGEVFAFPARLGARVVV
jgi:type VI secretion system protein ImpG